MQRYTNRAEARRADKGRRKVGSRIVATPHGTASGVCPVRLSAVGNEQVLRDTWMDCLRDLRANLTQIKNGVNVLINLGASNRRLAALVLVARAITPEMACCLEANLNNARIVKFGENFDLLVLMVAAANQLGVSGQEAAELPSLIDQIMEDLPTAEELAGIVGDFRIPYCPCSSCGDSYLGAATVFTCRHCHSTLKMGRKSYLPR